MPTGSDDIVTRLRELGRYVNTEGGRWFEPITTEAADEIERLRKELQHSALQTNVMRNIATTPFGGSAEQIADLGAELAEFQRQYQILKKEVNVWRGICERFAESDPRFDAFRIYFMAVRHED